MNQHEKLMRVESLLSFFSDHPRYHHLAKANLTMEDFYSIPIITKTDLIQEQETIRRKNICYVSRTSGTSGTTKQLLITHSQKAYEALLLRTKQIFNYAQISAQDIVINLFPCYIDTPGRYIEEAFKRHIGAGVVPVGYLSNDMLKKEAMSLVKTFSPTTVIGYTNQMIDFFDLLVHQKHQIRNCLTGGEPVTQIFQEQLKNLYHTNVYNIYGVAEFGTIGIGQSHESEALDLVAQDLWVEVLHDDGSVAETGEGDIVITDLENISTPFIRYRLGDRVKITQEGNQKKVQILGRSGGAFLYGTETFSLRALEIETQQVLNTKNFFYLIQKDPQTYKDIMILYTDIQHQEHLKEIQKIISHKFNFGKLFFVKNYHFSWPKTSTGKRRYLIDRRESQ